MTSERQTLFTDAERERVEALRAKSAAAWDARRGAFQPCSMLGHEDRVASHRAIWTVYGGGLERRLLCEECAVRALDKGRSARAANRNPAVISRSRAVTDVGTEIALRCHA